MRHIFAKKNRALLAELVRTDFKIRYQNSVLGYAWSLLRPLFLFLILYVVFVRVLKIGNEIPHFPVYLLLGIVIWNFFLEMTVQSLGSIVGRGDLVRKIKIPRWIIVVSASVAALINLSLNLVVVAVFMAVNHVELMRSVVLLPFILLEVYIFALGIAFFLSAAFVKYRDINYIWEVATQALFYLTPILYPLSKIPNLTIQKLLFINPLCQTIQDARYSVISHQTVIAKDLFQGGWHMYVPFVVVVITIIIGVSYFRSQSKYFAENI